MMKTYILSGFLFLGLFTFSQKVFAYPFNPQAPTILGGDMHLVESADINKDGKLDLIVTDGKTIAGFALLLGNGNGTFQAPKLISVGYAYEWGLALADVDKDGWIDVIVGNSQAQEIEVFVNTRTGNYFDSFSKYTVSNMGTSTHISVGDVDLDTYPDIVVSNSGTSIASVLLNDQTGNFFVSSSFGVSGSHGGSGSTLADVDKDGYLDLIIADMAESTVYIFTNDQTGNFIFKNSFYVAQPESASVADFDGDTIEEIIVASQNEGLYVYTLTGGQIFHEPGNAYYSKITDFDQDGKLDIVWTDESVIGIKVVLGDGSLGFSAPMNYPVNFSPLGVTVGDFDGDGFIDAAAVNHGNTLSIFLTQIPNTPGMYVNPSPVLPVINDLTPTNTNFSTGLTSEPSDMVIIEMSSTNNQVFLSDKNGNTINGICFLNSASVGNNPSPGLSVYEPCYSWNLGVTVGVNPIVDGISEGLHNDTIKFTVSSIDSGYNNFTLLDVTVPIVDDGDTKAPNISEVTISGPNGIFPDFKATSAEVVTLSFISDEFLNLYDSIIEIGGISAVCSEPTVITEEYHCTVSAGLLLPENYYGQEHNITISAVDLSTNTASTIMDTFDGSNVRIVGAPPVDTTTPLLSPITISSNGSNSAYAKTGNTVTLSFTSDDVLTSTTLTVGGQTVTPTCTGTGPVTCTATFNITNLIPAADGILPFSLTAVSSGGTTGPIAVTTDSSTVTVDRTAPVITIASPTAGILAVGPTTFAGTCETGITVNIAGSGFTPNPTTTPCIAGVYTLPIDVSGVTSLVASQRDLAGNTGSVTTATTLPLPVVVSTGGSAVVLIPNILTTTTTTTTTNTNQGSYLSPIDGTAKVCTPFTRYLKLGSRSNDIQEVKMWQAFLNKFNSESLPVTGFYGSLTFNAIKRFQVAHTSEILTPWGLTKPTGYTYKSTRAQGNKMLGCPEGAVLLDNGVSIK